MLTVAFTSTALALADDADEVLGSASLEFVDETPVDAGAP